MTTSCPECSSAIEFAQPPQSNEIVECGGCLVELEVLTVEPLALVVAPDVEEDWGE
jgi:alpha-aminoadipate carrier protein LysW